MKIYIKTKNNFLKWNLKKFIKNVAIAGTITTLIVLYANWFIQYNTYLNSLMK